MRRRTTLIGLGTIVLGSSGFIASGAFGFGSEGSVGGNWVQVDGTDIDEITSDDVDDDDPATGEIRIQVVVDPDNDGNRVNTGAMQWQGDIVDSQFVSADADGLLEAVQFDITNRSARSRVGRIESDGSVSSAAFLIANVGGVGNNLRGRPVDIGLALFDDDSSMDPDESIGNTDQIRFPYSVVTTDGQHTDSGSSLVGIDGQRLEPREVLEVAIEIDSSADTDDLEQIQRVGLMVRTVGSESDVIGDGDGSAIT